MSYLGSRQLLIQHASVSLPHDYDCGLCVFRLHRFIRSFTLSAPSLASVSQFGLYCMHYRHQSTNTTDIRLLVAHGRKSGLDQKFRTHLFSTMRVNLKQARVDYSCGFTFLCTADSRDLANGIFICGWPSWIIDIHYCVCVWYDVRDVT